MNELHPLESIEITFPEGVYADVRLERTVDHRIRIQDGSLDEVQSKTEVGALLRVMKNGSWYYASTTELETIDGLLAELASSEALPASEAPTGVEGLEIIDEAVWAFDDARIDHVPVEDKVALLRQNAVVLERESILTWAATWIDQHRDRRFVSSRGANVRHDYQECGFILRFSMSQSGETLTERVFEAGHRIADLVGDEEARAAKFNAFIDKCEHYVAHAEPIEPGNAVVVMSPPVTGVFAHESFGHKSEADFMLGDPSMLEDWKLGTQVASDVVSIVDSGKPFGSGYMAFDDEGQRAGETYLIRDGVLTGRLHSSMTAAVLGEKPTGNARALSFRYEPIVRMTTTTVAAGSSTREQVFSGVKDGYFIETVKHGSGMSTFTIAPSMSWRIRDGQIAEPVRIAVMTGTVFETLGEIDAVSDTVSCEFMIGGGCGKMEQMPLSVGLGGPYVRVKRMQVA